MEKQTNTKKTGRRLLIVSGLVVGAAAAGWMYWAQTTGYETTNNAQLDGDVLPIRAQLTGEVTQIRFTDNQYVHRGDTLMIFDTREWEAKLAQAAAALDNARANVNVSDRKAFASARTAVASYQTALSGNQDVEAARADLEKARQDLDRMKQLLGYKAATQEQADHAQTQFRVANANYARAVAQQQAAFSTTGGLKEQAQAEQGQISAARALVEQRQAEWVQVRQQMMHAYVVAPCNGLVTRRSVQQGQYVSSGAALCTVIDQAHLWVTANFKETQLAQIRVGEMVDIKVDAYPDLELRGRIASFGGATGARFSLLPPDNATGNFIKITQRLPVRIDLLSVPQNKPTVLFAGLSVFVKVKTT